MHRLPLHISITRSSVDPGKAEKVAVFLKDFLPKVRNLPGVVATYHYDSSEKGETTTIIIWKDKEALTAYRNGDLIKSAIDFEMRNGLKSTREAYPLGISL